MADNEKTDHTDNKSKEQYDKEAKEWNEDILKQLQNAELKDNIKIVIVIGLAGAGKSSLVKLITGEDVRLGHMLDDGTAIPTCVPAKVDGERYIFIDSPGFGHAATRPGVIKKQIQAMLGFFTRALGGIHAIIYVQDIMVERNMVGMGEAIDFLNELAGREIRPPITFITTKWDIPQSVPKLMRKCVDREARLKDVTWAKYEVGAPGGSRYFRHGVDCVEDSQQDQERGRALLWSNVMAHYRNVSAQSLVMPFSEWTYMDQGFRIATVTGIVIAVSGVVLSFAGFVALLVATGASVSVVFSISVPI